tara:strand:+ start:714 stop:995 length:282 start_codon:yes stop_codon:yes gene_type:complete
MMPRILCSGIIVLTLMTYNILNVKPINSKNLNENQLESNKVYDLKTFSGPMGMGLAKSFKMNKEKICVYNTIHGQKKVVLADENIDCPKNWEK